MEDERSGEAGAAAAKPAFNTAGTETGRATADPAGQVADREKLAAVIEFTSLDNAAYHQMREAFFSRLGKVLSGLQVAFGTTAFGAIFASFPDWVGMVAAALGALSGVVLLIIDPATLARDHRVLRARYFGILARFDPSCFTDKDLREARREQMELAGEEPPVYRAIAALSYNAAVDALNEEAEAAKKRLVVSWWYRAWAQFFTFNGKSFSERGPSDHDAGSASELTRSA